MKVLTIIAGVIVLVVVVLAITFSFLHPFVVSSICPQCVGLRNIGDDVYVENGAGTLHDADILLTIETAQKRVKSFYGGLTGRPIILICATESCYRHLEGSGGQTKAVTWTDRVVLVSPRGIDVVIISHELAHFEFHRRTGLIAMTQVPAWFDEGLAAYISDDPRYVAPPGQKNRCLVSPDGMLPVSPGDWGAQAPYAKAACRVSLWLASKGGASAVLRLIMGLHQGTAFNEAYSAAAKA